MTPLTSPLHGKSHLNTVLERTETASCFSGSHETIHDDASYPYGIHPVIQAIVKAHASNTAPPAESQLSV